MTHTNKNIMKLSNYRYFLEKISVSILIVSLGIFSPFQSILAQ